MSEKSVSQEAEARRESDWEKSRKPESPNQRKPKPADDAGSRAAQRERSIGKDKTNRGLNQDAGAVHESEAVPDRPMQYTKPQFERKHEQAPVVADGAIDNRKVKESSVAERHVQSDDGFKIAERRSASVAANRKETEKVFADRRKKSSANR
jgi:hypothetical protein